MKIAKKRVVSIMLVLAICASVLCGCFGGGDDTSDNTLLWYTTGKETARSEAVLAKINEILLEKTGYQVEFRYVSTQAYDLTVASGEEIDLIQAPDYLNFWGNAQKGSFAEITDEDLKKNAPFIWENCEALDFVKVKGVRYSIPRIGKSAGDRCIVVRGDLMDKAGVAEINGVESIEKYLDSVKANEPNMIPFDIQGNIPYGLFALWASDLKWSPISSVSYAQHVYVDLDDPEKKVFIAAEQPETLEFVKTMKRWNDKGFFSKSVLSNKTSSVDAFKAGRTAIAFLNGPADCQKIYNEFSQDDRAAWDVRFYTRYQNSQLENSMTGSMVAIGATSKKKEAAMKVLNECYSNKELYRLLITGGIENEDWVEKEDGSVEYIVPIETLAWFNTCVQNTELDFNQTYNFPGHEEILEKLSATVDVSPYVNMPKNEENVREIVVALKEVWNQYSTPRCYGIMTKSPEETLKEEVQMLKKAGIDAYVKELQKQVDEFSESYNK